MKSIYSIWSKMQRKQIPFEEIYDLFAIRIVFQAAAVPSEKTQCWQIYSTITDIYTPKPDRLRDWISMPKANGYEALHSTGDGSRRGMGRSADPHPAHGGHRRTRIRRPLEIQACRPFRRTRTSSTSG